LFLSDHRTDHWPILNAKKKMTKTVRMKMPPFKSLLMHEMMSFIFSPKIDYDNFVL